MRRAPRRSPRPPAAWGASRWGVALCLTVVAASCHPSPRVSTPAVAHTTPAEDTNPVAEDAPTVDEPVDEPPPDARRPIQVVATGRVLDVRRRGFRLATEARVIGADPTASRALLLESVWVGPQTARTDLRMISTESGETVEYLRGPARGIWTDAHAPCDRTRGRQGVLSFGADDLGCFGGRPMRDAVRVRALLSGLAWPEAAASRLRVAVTRSGDALAFVRLRHSLYTVRGEERTRSEAHVGLVRASGRGSSVSRVRWPPRAPPSLLATPLALSDDAARAAISLGYFDAQRPGVIWLWPADASEPAVEVRGVEAVGRGQVVGIRFSPRLPGFFVAVLGQDGEDDRYPVCVIPVSLGGSAGPPAACGTVVPGELRRVELRRAGADQLLLYPSGEGQATLLSLGPPVSARTLAVPRGARLLDVSPSGRWLLVAGGDASQSPAHFTLVGRSGSVSVQLRGEGAWTPSSGVIGERENDALRVLLHRGDPSGSRPLPDDSLLVVDMEEP